MFSTSTKAPVPASHLLTRINSGPYGVSNMLSKCANPQCSAEFHYLHEGRLFKIPTEARKHNGDGSKKLPHKLEHFWLCSVCSLTLTIAVDPSNKVLVLPREFRGHARSAMAS
jgi:hypothetical protein